MEGFLFLCGVFFCLFGWFLFLVTLHNLQDLSSPIRD